MPSMSGVICLYLAFSRNNLRGASTILIDGISHSLTDGINGKPVLTAGIFGQNLFR